ncbi:peptide synthetase [Nocardia cyriacigeorgica]|uniref:Peptide synthetase n=1 Tax=Nocardia cyriacigeorgica TaxID=135487 RepID=A0A6P1D8J0_9NOCA|nr:peptide synthetase [Nocardia cyriacigeorgica]NEW45250.1 peptide synthetase [Nocardia cyriacigeorgica]NEW51417.1 peptide synthetase [Nocardia cyriacigeorgica]NEW55347.1 peptide synthetase [Nocardia cyriacigeorgica]
MAAGTVFRRISPTERMYFPMRDLAPPFLMQLVFPGEGTVDPERLRQAIDVASAACPGSRLVRRGRDWVDSGVPAAVRVVDDWTIDYAALDGDRVLHTPIGPTSEVTCEVLLLTTRPVTLIFRAFHGVMDGMGLVTWALAVLAALRGQEPEPMPDPVADQELVRRVGAPGKPTMMLPKYRTAVGHGRQTRREPRHLLRRRTIAASGPGAVARVAALLAEQTTGTSRIMMPVDLRRHDPRLRSTGNLALPLFFDITAGTTSSEVNALKRSGLEQRRELNQMDNSGLAEIPQPAGRALLRTLNWLGARFGRNLASATVSHMGRFDLDELATPEFRPTSVLILPQHSVAMPLLFGLMESGGHTELTVSARNGRGVAERLDALLDRIVATLESDPATHHESVR